MTIVFEPIDDIAQGLSFALQDHQPTHVRLLVALQHAITERGDEALVVVGPSVDLETACAVADAERGRHPGLGVVLVRSRVDANILSRAMRAGIRDVVQQDDLRALVDACKRSLEVTRTLLSGGKAAATAAQASGSVVTVFSPKGGCGKTTIATNLAASLANGGRRVCIVDLDLAFGDVAIALQLFPTRTMTDAVNMESNIDGTAVRSLITSYRSGLDAILAPLEPSDVERIPASVVGELLRALKSMYDVVVVDTPPAFSDHVLAALDQSDHFVLLATLDIAAIKNLKLGLEMLDVLGYPRQKWHIVLNRADSKVGLEVADVEKSLNVSVAARIPSSRAVSSSVNRGIPLVLDQPNHPVSTAVRTLAETRISPRPTIDLRTERRGFRLSWRAEATA